MVCLVIPETAGLFLPRRTDSPLWHGEDNFHTSDMDVLEAGCAQGCLSLAIAPHVRTVLGYDATPNYIDLPCKAAQERSITNVTFVVHNSRAQYNGGQPHMPAGNHSVDLWVSSKGPGHAIKGAPRVLRPGGHADVGPEWRRTVGQTTPTVECPAARNLALPGKHARLGGS